MAKGQMKSGREAKKPKKAPPEKPKPGTPMPASSSGGSSYSQLYSKKK